MKKDSSARVSNPFLAAQASGFTEKTQTLDEGAMMEEAYLEIYRDLLRAVIVGPLTEEAAVMWMALLITHEIHLWSEPQNSTDAGEDQSHKRILEALSFREAADVIAELWPDRMDKKKCNYAHWYNEFVDRSRSRFGSVSDMPEDVQRKVEQLRQLLETHPMVLSVIEEE